MKRWITGLFVLCLTWAVAQEESKDPWDAKNFSGLKFRSIGPAFMSGRIADIAIHPEDENLWYIAVGSGGVWKTENAGVTWTPVFDDREVYSTGCITIDPGNPSVVWVGTGENVGGRHVGWGDGVYQSADGGKTWKNRGLKNSEHISKIIVHPSNSNIIWVAAQGPLWNKGGERGIYKTTDGGKTWKRTLGDDSWTGATDLVIDPRDPDHLYAATWDRHRTIAAYMGGGPGSGLHRSTDGGETWEKLAQGLPKSNMGKIGLAISPQNPDVLYAAIELDQRQGGIYKSVDKGSNWSKQSDVVSGATGPHYYQELYASPHQFDRLYLMDVRCQISEDGGKTFKTMKEEHKHSDNHAMAFRPSDPDYLLFGTDGGLYESFDLAENWRFVDNLPITQFYKLAVDDAEPFYHVYGGTQDNNTQGGPSRTDNIQGIQNSDWKVVLGGDGHQPATEPGNPNIVYGQSQQGYYSRIDLATGEVIKIQPQPGPNDPHERFNWDAPILVSSHKPSRVYVGSYRLWKSENRGDSWDTLSGTLTREQERLGLPVMGRVQSYDNAWDLYAMSTFNTITSIAESPHDEKVLFIGTDDGLIQRTLDMGKTWTKIEVGSLPNVPATAYVNDVKVDLFDPNTVYVALDNHKHGDLKPYLFKSSDKGKTWTSLTNGLPEKTIVWRLVQDHEDKNLLFIGTEFGVYFSVDGGKKWIQLKGGLPTIPFRDITIQRRENDLVAASFGRSFYVYDDISAFREIEGDVLKKEGHLFESRDALWYVPRANLEFGKGKGSQGASHYIADNPPFGAVFTYYLADGYKSKKEMRQEAEKKLNKAGEDVPFPGWEDLDEELTESPVQVWLVVSNANDEIVRKIPGPIKKGFHRVAWDLRMPPSNLVKMGDEKIGDDSDFLVSPGTYSAQLVKEEDGTVTALSEKRSFEVKPMRKGTLDNPLADQRDTFWRDYEDLLTRRSIFIEKFQEAEGKVKALGKALVLTPTIETDLSNAFHDLRKNYYDFKKEVDGSPAKNKIGEKTKPTLDERIWALYGTMSRTTYGPTPAGLEMMAIAENLLAGFEIRLVEMETSLSEIASRIRSAGGPPVEGLD